MSKSRIINIIIIVVVVAIAIVIVGLVRKTRTTNYVDKSDPDLTEIMPTFGIYENAIENYGVPKNEYESEDGIERVVVYDGITAVYRHRGVMRLQITDPKYTFGPEKVSIGTDKSVILDLFKYSDSAGKTICTLPVYTENGKKIQCEVYVYYSDNYEHGMGFRFDSNDKVDLIFIYYGL
jgi:hypothetical protein